MPTTIHIVPEEQFNPVTEEFYTPKPQTIKIEHSLISISKWESKWHKCYLESADKTREQILDYVRCMSLNSNVDPDVFKYLPPSAQNEVAEYLNDPATATVLKQQKNGPRSKDKMTSEYIYYLMTVYGIPFECEKWNIKRLLMLIQICLAKSQSPKKRGKNDLWNEYSAMHKARKARK